MKKSTYSKLLAFLFVATLVMPLAVSFQSCKSDKHNKLNITNPEIEVKKLILMEVWEEIVIKRSINNY